MSIGFWVGCFITAILLFLLVGLMAHDPVTAASTPFSDVPPTHPYSEAVRDIHATGVVDGFADGTFRPDSPVLRAQFAKMIMGVFSDPEGDNVRESLQAPFGDLGPDDPHTLYPHDYIAAAAHYGITRGTTATTFSPWRTLSRGQMITMVIRAGDNDFIVGPLKPAPPGFVPTLGAFSSAHGQSMARAEYLGLLDGVVAFGPGWDPWAPASRGEMAQVLRNYIDNGDIWDFAGD